LPDSARGSPRHEVSCWRQGCDHMLINLLIVNSNYQEAKFTARNIHTAHPDWQIVLVNSYREAMRAAEVSDLNAAIIDLILPDGNGFDLLIELRGRNPALSPIILTPSLSTHRFCEIVKSHGGFSVMEKPVDSIVLVNSIEQALAQFSERKLSYGMN
jgi:DNA-binding NtrC family response regulator